MSILLNIFPEDPTEKPELPLKIILSKRVAELSAVVQLIPAFMLLNIPFVIVTVYRSPELLLAIEANVCGPVNIFVQLLPPSVVFNINPPGGIHPVPPQSLEPPTA